MNIFSSSDKKNHSGLLHELLQLKDYFSDKGRISVLCHEFGKLHDNIYGDINPFDNYRAEKILTEFLGYFVFLTNYKMISIRKIEYHNIKQCEQKFIQYCSFIGFLQGGRINDQATADTFTHAVCLQNRTDEKQCLNLYPFVIDRNVFKKDDKSEIHSIAFFNYQNNRANYLDYNILNFRDVDNNPEYNKFRPDIFTDKNDIYSINIEKYNTYRLLESFDKIKKILTSN